MHSYCDTTYDHGIGELVEVIETSSGTLTKTVKEICEALGQGPGRSGRPIYNDIQCGNGPTNLHDILDEIWCPGRADLGIGGCG